MKARKILFLLVFLIFSSFLFAEEPAMFLCVDSMASLKKSSMGREPQKLVYGYINGKKTPCMTEYELRQMFQEESLKKARKGVEKEKKKTLERNAVYRGEKNLVDADLSGLDLQNLNLSGANLRGANLTSTDLRGVNFENADLENASLENAYCKHANFSGANLKGTNLKGAFLHYANLKGAKGLTIEALTPAASLYEATLEDSLLEIIKSDYPQKLKKTESGGWCQSEPGQEDENYPMKTQKKDSFSKKEKFLRRY
ncbi:MAG: pentapeptide repeat-containing protein [Chitinispirillaceae bacterium]|nr:pentapeptide repeat-containing protein [Chitinispirillaceae bacterium]